MVRAVYQGLVHLSPLPCRLKKGTCSPFLTIPDSSGLDYLGTALDTILYTTQEGFFVGLREYRSRI